MLKRINAMILAAVLLLGCMTLFSCKGKGEETEETNSNTQTPEQTQSPETEVSATLPESESESETEPEPGKVFNKVVVLGDSISTGYGLMGYVAGSGNEGIASFANDIAKTYSMTLGTDFFNLAVDGYKSEDILNVINSKSDIVEGADLILITMGGNDLMMPLINSLGEIAGVALNDYLSLAFYLTSIMTGGEAVTEVLRQSYAVKAESIDTRLQGLVDEFKLNFDEIHDRLSTLAPDATILVQTVFDPLDDAFFANSPVEYVDSILTAEYLGRINVVIREKAAEYGYLVADIEKLFLDNAAICTNILSSDIHPSAMGHSMIGAEIKTILNEIIDK